MKKVIFALLVVLSLNGVSEARGHRNRQPVANTVHAVAHIARQTAQESANLMAKIGHIQHFGGHHPYFEGVACASNPIAAYNTCCYANAGMKDVEYGIAQGANGMFYCCRRYSR